MAEKKKSAKKKDVPRLFEIQTEAGFHLGWCDNEEQVKAYTAKETEIRSPLRVYQLIGTFVPQKPVPMVWKKLER